MLYTMMNISHSLPVELLLLVKTGSYAGKHQTLLQRIPHSLLFPLVQWSSGQEISVHRIDCPLLWKIASQNNHTWSRFLLGKTIRRLAPNQPRTSVEQSIISTFYPSETMLLFGSNFKHCIIIINYCYL